VQGRTKAGSNHEHSPMLKANNIPSAVLKNSLGRQAIWQGYEAGFKKGWGVCAAANGCRPAFSERPLSPRGSCQWERIYENHYVN